MIIVSIFQTIFVTIQILLVFDIYISRRRFQAISKLRRFPARHAGKFSGAEDTECRQMSQWLCIESRLDNLGVAINKPVATSPASVPHISDGSPA